MESVTPPKQPKPREIPLGGEKIVPSHFIKPFARGLFQLSSEPIEKIKETLSAELGGTDLEREQINEMGQALNEITTTLLLLRTAKEVKITRPTENQYKLTLSSETDKEEIPREGDELMDEFLSRPLMAAVFDRLCYDFARFRGYAELLEARSTSEKIRERMRNIHTVAIDLNNAWSPIQNAGYQIKISTDAQGKTTITPIPRPNP